VSRYDRRVGKVFLPLDQLHALLGLPDDVTIVDIRVQRDPLRMSVQLEGERFPIITPGCESPYVQLSSLKPAVSEPSGLDLIPDMAEVTAHGTGRF
jgi:hypothetical protein